MWRREILSSFPSYFAGPEPGLGLGDTKLMKDLKNGKVPKFPKRWSGILAEAAGFDLYNLDHTSLRVRIFTFRFLPLTMLRLLFLFRHLIYTILSWISLAPLFGTP
jgi:hypothetical protein